MQDDKIYLVPTRSVGIHADRAAVCSTQRVTAFPRGAWERETMHELFK